MVRALQARPNLVDAAYEAKQRARTFECGLLVAQIGSRADLLLRLVPTPANDEGGTGAARSLDAGWMLEHAVQVRRMLPGGVGVIGAYILAPTAKLAALEAQLHPVLARTLAELERDGAVRAEGCAAHAVVLHMPADAKRFSCRALSAPSAKPQPIELKTSAPALHRLTCDVSVELDATLFPAGAAATREALLEQMGPWAEGVRGAAALVDGATLLVDGATAAVESLPRAGDAAEPHTVELFFGPSAKKSPKAPSGSGMRSAQRASIRGEVRALALATGREELRFAVAALRADLIATVGARLQLLIDEATDAADDADDGAEGGAEGGGAGGPALPLRGSGPVTLALPRRVHVDGGDHVLCDYVGGSEDFADAAERCETLLGVEVAEGADVGPERAATNADALSALFDASAGAAAHSETPPPAVDAAGRSGGASSRMLPIAMGALAAAAAALAALVLNQGGDAAADTPTGPLGSAEMGGAPEL